YGFYMFQSNGFMSFIFEAYMNVVVMGYIQSFAVISMPIIWLYNGKAGSRKYKWLFYIYYPAHLLILFLLREFGGNYFV
ncbi:MAG: conjugal transfer protein TraX, partial [Lachnospiraceae bacterium]|nr:conjugal transfer protein TraX [Lachnospiraceae bacterium]